MYLTWLADAARETGYPVVEVDGWKSRSNRESGMRSASGIVNHWTAGPEDAATASNYPSLNVVREGRPGLVGLLAQLGIGFDGTVYTVGAGIAWHAGASYWRGMYDLNPDFIGIEVESPGNFVYTLAQQDVLPRLNAALLRRMGRPSGWAAAHFEVATPAGRKPDGPARDMNAWREKVAAYLANPSAIPRRASTTPPKETIDVALTPEEREELDRIDRRTRFLQAQNEQILAWSGAPTVAYRADGNYPTPTKPTPEA